MLYQERKPDISHKSTSVRLVDMALASFLSAILLPLWVMNLLYGLLTFNTPIVRQSIHVRKDKTLVLHQWKLGAVKKSLILLDIVRGEISFCGTPLNVNPETINEYNSDSFGIFNHHALHESTGYVGADEISEASVHSAKSHLLLIVKSAIAHLLFSRQSNECPETFSLFGISMNNVSITEAISIICTKTSNACKSVYFVNVNSINLSCKNSDFKRTLIHSDYTFVDGSGVRMAASSINVQLKDNVNGTDLLPHLCRELEDNNQSIFLLGAEPGVAGQAALNLRKQYPNLNIAGTHHGYFEDNYEVIYKINESKADLLLVAMGSPFQEAWIEKNKYLLAPHKAIAVGGLFDFYSGKIPRAPVWMRELGIEWVYRLIQEPKSKFNRYVIGNPIFLWRAFISRKA